MSFAHKAPFSPILGLEEGEARLDCPPGTRKAYLPAWPWQECVPEDEILAPGEETSVILPEEDPESMLPAAPPPPLPPAEPRRARFLKVDPISGEVVDPDTNLPIEMPSAFPLTPVETAATAGVALGVTALLLVVFGVLK